MAGSLAAWLDRAAALGLTGAVSRSVRALVHEAEAIKRGGQPSARRARRTSSAKRKGHQAVVEVRALILERYGLQEDDILIQTTSVGGQDLHLSPAAGRVFPFAIEVKNVEQINIWKALAQAEQHAVKKGRLPVVFFRKNGRALHVAVDAQVFLNRDKVAL